MPNPFSKLSKKFGKKNAKPGQDVEAVVANKDESGEQAEIGGKKSKKKKKDGTLKKFKSKFKITLNRKNSKSDEGDSESSGGADKSSSGGKAKKAKKPKKEKVKREKKPKPKKVKKAKKSGEEGEEGGKKKFPILWVAIGGGAILIGVAAFLIVSPMIKNKGPSVKEQLLNASICMTEERYDDAVAIYETLLTSDATLVEAYTGMADAKAAKGDIDGAVQRLTEALIPTEEDPLIKAKIYDLSLAPETDPNGEVATPSITESPIIFQDAAFEKMLRTAMNKPSGNISEKDLEEVTSIKILGGTHAVINDSIPAFNEDGGYKIDGVLYTEHGGISSLNDLAHFKNLRKVTVAYNNISDISGISSLTKLETVGLYFNNINSIAPLSNLKELRFLYIYNNQISDISPLSGLTLMEQLWLSENKITDISAVKGLTELTELFVSDNEITDISAVSNLKNLGFFYADRNNISDISALKDLSSLTDVSFVDNPVEDYSSVSHVNNINRPFG